MTPGTSKLSFQKSKGEGHQGISNFNWKQSKFEGRYKFRLQESVRELMMMMMIMIIITLMMIIVIIIIIIIINIIIIITIIIIMIIIIK